MPQANIWIKEENWDYWQSIKEKSEFVNAMVHHHGIPTNSSDSNPYTHEAVIKIKKEMEELTYEPINP